MSALVEGIIQTIKSREDMEIEVDDLIRNGSVLELIGVREYSSINPDYTVNISGSKHFQSDNQPIFSWELKNLNLKDKLKINEAGFITGIIQKGSE